MGAEESCQAISIYNIRQEESKRLQSHGNKDQRILPRIVALLGREINEDDNMLKRAKLMQVGVLALLMLQKKLPQISSSKETYLR